MKKTALIFLAIIISGFSPLLAHVNPSYYCVQTGQTVSVGDSMEKAQAACGVPTQVTTQNRNITRPSKESLLQWIYTQGIYAQTPKGVLISANVPQLIFTFKDDKVIEVQRINATGNRRIPCDVMSSLGIGTSQYLVLAACGNPNYIRTLQKAETVEEEITTWTYEQGVSSLKVLFIFTNGKLTDIRSG